MSLDPFKLKSIEVALRGVRLSPQMELLWWWDRQVDNSWIEDPDPIQGDERPLQLGLVMTYSTYHPEGGDRQCVRIKQVVTEQAIQDHRAGAHSLLREVLFGMAHRLLEEELNAWFRLGQP